MQRNNVVLPRIGGEYFLLNQMSNTRLTISYYEPEKMDSWVDPGNYNPSSRLRAGITRIQSAKFWNSISTSSKKQLCPKKTRTSSKRLKHLNIYSPLSLSYLSRKLGKQK